MITLCCQCPRHIILGIMSATRKCDHWNVVSWCFAVVQFQTLQAASVVVQLSPCLHKTVIRINTTGLYRSTEGSRVWSSPQQFGLRPSLSSIFFQTNWPRHEHKSCNRNVQNWRCRTACQIAEIVQLPAGFHPRPLTFAVLWLATKWTGLLFHRLDSLTLTSDLW